MQILKLPPPPVASESATEPVQLLIANIDYDDFKGKLGIGRLTAGTLTVGDTVGFTKPGEDLKKGKISELFIFDNLGRTSVKSASAGEIVVVAGLADVMIGDTVVDKDDPKPMEPIAVEEPTVRMTFRYTR